MTIILPASLNVTERWAECFTRNSVMCWRALANVLLAYAQIELHKNCFTVANDLLTLSELAQQHASILAPFEDMEAA